MSKSFGLLIATAVVLWVAGALWLGSPPNRPISGESTKVDDPVVSESMAMPESARVEAGDGSHREDGDAGRPDRAVVSEQGTGLRGRRVRGRCVTIDGVPLRRGHIHLSSSTGLRGRPVEAIVENGEFDVVLPEHIGFAGHACAMVVCDTSLLFQGQVRIADYVVIEVRSPNDAMLAPSGRVSIWGPAPTKWRVTAFAVGHRAVLAGEMGDAHQRSVGDVVLTLLDVGAADRAQRVVLQLGDASAAGPGSGVAAIEFSSWGHLAKALVDGVVFKTAYQSLDVGERSAEFKALAIWALQYGAPIARDVPIVAGMGQAIVGSPGVYGALATRLDGGRVRGEIHILPRDLGSTSKVEWMQEEGGSESAEVIVSDGRGMPVDGVLGWWRPAHLPADHGYEVWGAAVDGEPGRLRVTGLSPGDHVVHVQSANGDRFVDVPCRIPAAEPYRITLPEAGRIVLDLVQSVAFHDVLPAPELWFRTGSAWQRRKLEPPAYAPVLRGMPFGTYEVAVRAGDLIGMATVSLGGANEVVRVPLTYAFRIAGRVVFRDVGRTRDTRVAVSGGSMPWQSAGLGSDGSFVLWSEEATPSLVLVHAEGRSVTMTWQHDPANPTVEASE